MGHGLWRWVPYGVCGRSCRPLMLPNPYLCLFHLVDSATFTSVVPDVFFMAFCFSASIPSAAIYFFRSAQSFLSFDQVALVLHTRGPPMPTRTRPKPQRATAEDPHWESLPNLGLGTRLASSAWHVLNTTHISTSKLNTHERPHTYKARPYPRGPTHLPQPWRRGKNKGNNFSA